MSDLTTTTADANLHKLIRESEILRLPPLAPTSWALLSASSSSNARLLHIGELNLLSILCPVVTSAVYYQKEKDFVSLDNKELVTSLLLKPTTTHGVLSRIKSYGDEPNCPFQGSEPEVVHTFLLEYIGYLVTERKHGLRNLRPWVIETYRPLAKRVVQTMTMRSLTKARKREASAGQTKAVKRAEIMPSPTNAVGREIVAAPSRAVLTDRTNTPLVGIPYAATFKLPPPKPRMNPAAGSSRATPIILSP
ncbi:hypothetical protein DFH06DRAFT_1177207 [Mycena polygramma]|nr:hypothetical protein DFH06DRAFT_1177207 [Mycena polygramma]